MAGKSSRQLWTDSIKNGSLGTKTRMQVSNYEKLARRGYEGIIIGIDPSLRGTGVAIIKSRANACEFLFSERLSFAPRVSFYKCLADIYKKIDSIVVQYSPNCAALEQSIFVQNYRVAQILGSVRGAVVSSIAGRDIDVCEYPPLRVKQAVTGVGRASKEQVMRTVKNLLRIGHDISYDEADALAVACCHAWTFSENLKTNGARHTIKK